MRLMLPMLAGAAMLALIATPVASCYLAGRPSPFIGSSVSIDPLPSLSVEPLLPGTLF